MIILIIILAGLWAGLGESSRFANPVSAVLALVFSVFIGFSVVEDIKTGRMWTRGTNIYKSTNPIAFWFLICLYSAGALVFFIAALKITWAAISG